MTLDQVRRILTEHKYPSFDRDTVEGLVAEIDRLDATQAQSPDVVGAAQEGGDG